LRYTKRQIEKHERQKYIACLGKISRNLFRMFRDRGTTAQFFKNRFSDLLTCLESVKNVRVDSEYLIKTEAYIRKLSRDIEAETFDDIQLDGMREMEMSNLNRLQKMKNSAGHKKPKHRNNAGYQNRE